MADDVEPERIFAVGERLDVVVRCVICVSCVLDDAERSCTDADCAVDAVRS